MNLFPYKNNVDFYFAWKNGQDIGIWVVLYITSLEYYVMTHVNVEIHYTLSHVSK